VHVHPQLFLYNTTTQVTQPHHSMSKQLGNHKQMLMYSTYKILYTIISYTQTITNMPPPYHLDIINKHVSPQHNITIF
jgi:hypothetical protein